jgi:hypothetical protein
MPPIAIASARKAHERTASSEPIVRRGRPLNTRRMPSVAQLLATTGTIESLAAMREHMLEGVASGSMKPSAKTFVDWEAAIWVRVFQLMALRPRRAPYIYNVTLLWPKPPGLQEALWAQMEIVTRPLPSEAAMLEILGTPIQR